MFELFLALFLAFACPAHNHKDHSHNGDQVTTLDDTGGDQEHLPPPPPPPSGN